MEDVNYDHAIQLYSGDDSGQVTPLVSYHRQHCVPSAEHKDQSQSTSNSVHHQATDFPAPTTTQTSVAVRQSHNHNNNDSNNHNVNNMRESEAAAAAEARHSYRAHHVKQTTNMRLKHQLDTGAMLRTGLRSL